MIFLLKVEIKKLPDIPVKDFLGFVVKEWEYFIRMSKRGRILAGGKLAGSRGAAAIIEADSNEECMAELPEEIKSRITIVDCMRK